MQSTNLNGGGDDSGDSFTSSSQSSSFSSSSSSTNEDLSFNSKSFVPSLHNKSNFRRRGTVGYNSDDTNVVLHSNSNMVPSRNRRRNSNSGFCSYSTIALVSTFLLWCYTQFEAPFGNSDNVISWNNRPIRERTRARTRHKRRWSPSLFESFHAWRDSFPPPKKTSSESLPPDCQPLPWHANHYPNCNLVHTIDLPDLSRQRMYVASGLWRSVWNMKGTAVAKIMKSDHDVTSRNFERHRRDAVVMERYTASPYVVDIYGFCGNTVVTERSPQPLDGVVLVAAAQPGHEPQRTMAPLQQRIAWARDVARGVAVLHADHVVHADLQAKQFLLSTDGTPAVVKINDFNRCRFMAMKTITVVKDQKEDGNNHANATPTTMNTTTPCQFYIPSAPGKQRSPEEYNSEILSEKLDIYSLANILFAIWSGERPWDRYGAGESKRMIVKGKMPPSPFAPDSNTATTDALWTITAAAYARNPDVRPSAQEIADTLDRILQQLLEQGGG